MKEKEILYNEKIPANKLKIIDDGVDLGIMTKKDAIKMAQDRGLDVVVVSMNTDPVVAKFLDYNKYLYNLNKKKKLIKKTTKVIETKTVQLRYCTDSNDLNTKMNHVREFLAKGNKVVFVMKIKKKEIPHIPEGKALLEKILLDLNVKVDKSMSITEKLLTVTVRP